MTAYASASENTSPDTRVALPKSTYSLDFPGPAECGSTSLQAGGLKVPKEFCSYFNKSVGHGFDADYMILPSLDPLLTAEDALKRIAAGAAASSKSRVLSESLTTVDGHPALDAVFVPVEPGYIAFLRYVLIGNHLITITADGYKSVQMPIEVERYLMSLKTK
nr:hypothetical protein [uncultured Undibacterium sp.]